MRVLRTRVYGAVDAQKARMRADDARLRRGAVDAQNARMRADDALLRRH